MLKTIRFLSVAMIVPACLTVAFAAAQDDPDAAPRPDAAATDAAESSATEQPAEEPKIDLGREQRQIENDFQRFEDDLFKLSEALRGSDPDRSDLLTRTRSQSKEQRILQQMKVIAVQLEEGDEFGDALERQQQVILQLDSLIKLLQSEDARDRLAKEIARLEAHVKELNAIIGEEKDVRADTERRGDPDDLEGDQQRVADRARGLADKIDKEDAERAAENESASGSQGEGETGEGEPKESGESEPKDPADTEENESKPEDGDLEQTKPSEGEPSEGEPSEGEPSEGEPSEGKPSEGKPSEGKPSEGKPSEGKPSEGKPSEGKPSEGKPSGEQQTGQQDSDADPGEQTPGREELEQAIEEMNQAIEELRKQDHDGASDEQDEALAQLEAMKAKLEEILRQLREKEKELFLAMLEARFQEMLRVQLLINAETVRIDKVPVEQRGSNHATKSTDLSRDQYENALDADQALILLKEEGSSVAFPEAVEQMRDNMLTVVGRLEKADTGETTQLIEQIIVETLDEMIFALQRELEKMKEQEQEPQEQQNQEQDPPLVDVLAELKMIRALQSQINRLTRQIGLQVEGEQALEQDALDLLADIARRQERIQEATYDLSTGKTSLGQQLQQ